MIPDKITTGADVNTTQNDGQDVEDVAAYLPKRRRTTTPKGTTRPKATPTKRPVKLMLDTDVYEALVIHGLRRGENLSDLVAGLIRKNLTEWSIHARPKQ
jgi:uncharacterized protein (DUF4415 family)